MEAALWFKALILSVVLTVLLQEPIHWVLARFLGGLVPRRPRGVKGLWEGRYTYGKEGATETQIVELRQVGSYVLGKNLTGAAHWYTLRGRVEFESVLTGIWRSRKEGNIYHGAFQAVIDPKGEVMRGRWIGFGRSNEINDGPWELRLLARKVDRRTKAEMLSRSNVTSGHA